MDELRLILLGVGAVFIALIYLWGMRSQIRARLRRPRSEPSLNSGDELPPAAAPVDDSPQPDHPGASPNDHLAAQRLVDVEITPIRRSPAQRGDPPARPQPRAEAPPGEPPRAEPPRAESPRAESPRAESPRAESPRAESPRAESPQVEAAAEPPLEPSRVEPVMTEPPLEPPRAEPKVDPPKVEPKVERKVEPRVEPPKVESKPEPVMTEPKARPRPEPVRPRPQEPRPAARQEPALEEEKPADRSGPEKVIAMTVLAPRGQPYQGRDVVAACEALGLRPAPSGLYESYSDRSAAGDTRPVLAMAHLKNPGTFDLDTVDALATPGLLLFARLPGPLDGISTLERLATTARDLASRLGGSVCDERRNKLTQQALGHMRFEITEFERQLRVRSQAHA